jgi:hypothetical protein
VAKKIEQQQTEINILPLKQGVIKLRIIGTTALFQNRMAAKAKQQLLVGGQKKSKADRATIKHAPEAEFRDSAQTLPNGPTALGINVIAVKAAMSTAALETPGLTKTSAQRLLFMPGDFAPLYGTPQLRMDVVRSADVNRTPDVRSRCYIPHWGAEIDIRFVSPQLSATSVINLLVNAGILVGVGDFRQEKGKGSFGSFRVLGEGTKDAEWDELVKNHGRKAQLAALKNPEYADNDTRDLMEYFFSEVKRRAA